MTKHKHHNGRTFAITSAEKYKHSKIGKSTYKQDYTKLTALPCLNGAREADVTTYQSTPTSGQLPAWGQITPLHSTTLLTSPIKLQWVSTNKLSPRRTVAMTVELSKTFNTVDRTDLLQSIHKSTMDSNTVRRLCTYLQGRTASCIYNRKESAKITLQHEVQQGSVLSPQLSNLYVPTYPETSELCTSYADDFTASTSHSNVKVDSKSLAKHAADVAAIAEESRPHSVRSNIDRPAVHTTNHTMLSPSHSSSELVSTSSWQKSKNSGSYLRSSIHFHNHVENLANKAKPRLNILRQLCGTDWGQQKETIMLNFKTLIRLRFTYAAPIWFPNTSETSIKKLQVIQNSALLIATV